VAQVRHDIHPSAVHDRPRCCGEQARAQRDLAPGGLSSVTLSALLRSHCVCTLEHPGGCARASAGWRHQHSFFVNPRHVSTTRPTNHAQVVRGHELGPPAVLQPASARHTACSSSVIHTGDAGGRPARRLPGALPSPLSVAARLAARLAAGEQSQPPLQHTCSRVNHVIHLHVKCTRRGPQPPRELAAHAATESRRAGCTRLPRAHGLRLWKWGAPVGLRRRTHAGDVQLEAKAPDRYLKLERSRASSSAR
jgi:hypothetical protein